MNNVRDVLAFLSGVLFGVLAVWGFSCFIYAFVPYNLIISFLTLVGFVVIAEKIFMATISGYFKLLCKIFD
jgi:hypothetical protein